MTKYRKRPAVVEMEQFFWSPDSGSWPPGVRYDKEAEKCFVTTMHKGQRCYLEEGDWVAREPDKIHYYPIKADDQANTYDIADEPWPQKPILCMDFDGVIHSYTSGWLGADVIPDKPVPGAFDFLLEAIKHWSVRIYSSRSIQEGGIEAMKDWFKNRGWPCEFKKEGWVLNGLEFPYYKPPANMTIDDRAVCFDGTWPNPVELLSFKPWNKK